MKNMTLRTGIMAIDATLRTTDYWTALTAWILKLAFKAGLVQPTAVAPLRLRSPRSRK
jgi:hypothetical protein